MSSTSSSANSKKAMIPKLEKAEGSVIHLPQRSGHSVVSITQDYTEENEYLTNRIEEQIKTITKLKEKQVDQSQVASSKEEFKKKSNELAAENEKLLKEQETLLEQVKKHFATEIEACKKSIQALDKQYAQFLTRYEEASKRISELEGILTQREYRYTTELMKEKERLSDIQLKADRASIQLQQLRSREENSWTAIDVNEFLKERNQMLEFIMDRGNDIQEQEIENARLVKVLDILQKSVTKLTEEVAQMKEPV